jgi:putative transposase
MEEHAVHKTFKYKLNPTAEQEREFESVLLLCRRLYNTALEQRKTAYERCSVFLSRFDQEAGLKDIRAEMPEYAGVYSHVLQDVLARLDRAFQAFFLRIREGQTPGYPRFQGRGRYHSFTYKEFGNGARLDNGFLILPKIGRLAVRWSRSLKGTPKTVTLRREADGWYGCISCADAPVQPLPIHRTGDRHRPGARSLHSAVRWDAHLPSRLVSPGRARARPRNAAVQGARREAPAAAKP